MGKQTIFLSHSSKDKDLILKIKDKIDETTGGALEIFMSSDGQSIPFGMNWVHKIEQGLREAQIMFVFVTENSISSGWIYFEAGYAYSKGIRVIPVGIGIDIGALKAPLNLLQGYNVTSADSLNNFISIINSTFGFHFKEVFSETDYLEVIEASSFGVTNTVDFSELIGYAEYSLSSIYTLPDGTKETRDIGKYFERIITYFDSNKIQYSSEPGFYGTRITHVVARGIKISYRAEKTDSSQTRSYDDYAYIKFRISPHNFENSFEILKDLMQLQEGYTQFYIKLHLNHECPYLWSNEDISSILSEYPDEYSMDRNHIDGYIYEPLNLSFYIFDSNANTRIKTPDFVVSIFYDCSINGINIMNLLYRLHEIKLIQ